MPWRRELLTGTECAERHPYDGTGEIITVGRSTLWMGGFRHPHGLDRDHLPWLYIACEFKSPERRNTNENRPTIRMKTTRMCP